MKRVIYLLSVIGFSLAAASCAKEARFQEKLLADGDKVPVALTCEPLDFELEEGTKSHLGNNILTKVSNVNYYLFDKEGNFVSQGYTEDLGEFGIALPDIDAHYQCFFFANVGQFTIPETTKASEMGTAVHYDFQSYDNYSSSVNGYGFPMAAGVADFNKSNAGNVTVKRLVHTLRVKINTAALNASQLTVKNVRVRQAPRDFFPFAEKSKLTAQFGDKDILETGADWLSAEEVEKINNGEEVRLYILENMRGELIPGNTEWKNKTPQNVRPLSEANLATYIEIETSVVTPTANYENVVYRAYLGKSPSNFDVQRSTSFLLTNVFTSDMVPDEDWRIDPGEPVITGTLCFMLPANNSNHKNNISRYFGPWENTFVNVTNQMVPSNEPTLFYRVPGSSTSHTFYLTDGFEQTFFIYRSNKNIKYKVLLSKGEDVRPYLGYTISQYSDNYDKITIRSTRKETLSSTIGRNGFQTLSDGTATGVPYSTNAPNNVYPVTVTIESEDGLLSDQVDIHYFYGKMGAAFRYGSNGLSELRVGNPLRLVLSTNLSGKVGFFYNGINDNVQMKSNIGVDKSFLKYVGALNSITDKYGRGKNQTSPMRYFNIYSHCPDGTWVDVCVMGGIFTFGVSWLPVFFECLDAETGTMNSWNPSILYVPFQSTGTMYGSYYNGFTPCYSFISDITAPSQYWGNYDKAIENWGWAQSLRDVFSVFGENRGGNIVASAGIDRHKVNRHPDPFCVETYIDVLLGAWCDMGGQPLTKSNGVLYSAPTWVVSYQKGLAISDFSYGSLDMDDLPEAYVSFSKNLIQDQTEKFLETSRRGTSYQDNYFCKAGFKYQDGINDIDFLIHKNNVLSFSEYPRMTQDNLRDYISQIGQLYDVGWEDTSDRMMKDNLEHIWRKYLFLPDDIQLSFKNNNITPEVKIPRSVFNDLNTKYTISDYISYSYSASASNITLELWDYLKLPSSHYGTYVMNSFVDYIGQ